MNPQVLSSQDSFFVTFIASLLIWLMFFGVGILWFVDGKQRKEEALHGIFSILVTVLVVFAIKSLLPIPRPFELNGFIPRTLTIPDDSSFPSSHAATAAALATSVYLHNKKGGIFFILCAALVALGRVYSNVHTWLDIGVGVSIGIICSQMVSRLHLYKALK